MESIEQHLEEVGRVGQVLNIDRHHLEPVLGMVAQVIHDAGLAGSSGRGEHDMPGAQGPPQLRQKRPAESQVNRVDGSAGIEFRGVVHFQFIPVVNLIRCMNNCTTILMYVNCVVEMRRERLPRCAARRTSRPRRRRSCVRRAMVIFRDPPGRRLTSGQGTRRK